MKSKFIIPLATVLMVIFFTACLKDNDLKTCTPNTVAQDHHVIDSFLNDNDLNYVTYNPTYDVYTGVTNPGTGSQAAEDSIVAFKYTVTLMNGTSILTDSVYQNNGVALRMNNFSQNSIYYYFLRSVKQGGEMKVIIPSSSASGFGCQQQTTNTGVVIPAYSQLIYDFTLTAVKQNF